MNEINNNNKQSTQYESQHEVKLISEEDRELLKERMATLWSSLSDELKQQ